MTAHISDEELRKWQASKKTLMQHFKLGKYKNITGSLGFSEHDLQKMADKARAYGDDVYAPEDDDL